MKREIDFDLSLRQNTLQRDQCVWNLLYNQKRKLNDIIIWYDMFGHKTRGKTVSQSVLVSTKYKPNKNKNRITNNRLM